MALTDADRMQMALMVVMRHNVITVGGPPTPAPSTWFGGVKEVYPVLNPVIPAYTLYWLPQSVVTRVTITSTIPFADYIAA